MNITTNKHTGKDNPTCGYCNKIFSKQCNLGAHVKNIHELIEPKRSVRSLVCSICFLLCSWYKDLRDHLATQHDYEIDKEEAEFESISDFQSWKETKERVMICLYVKTRGTVRCTNNSKRSYYVCHRSNVKTKYKSTTLQENKRLPKSQGSAKLTVTCPSTMELLEKEGKVKMVLFLPHVGHEYSFRHINLTRAERMQIAGKIAEGVSFSKILDDVRNISAGQKLKRIHLLSHKDLTNIKNEFHLQTHQLHQDDVISVDIWVESMRKLQDDCPVLYFKKQGVIDPEINLQKEDFFLGIMTPFQMSILTLFGSEKICVDTTHGTTGYDFLLTSVVTINEYGEGIPVAFLLSTKVNSTVLQVFFNLIKSKVGQIQTQVFMSDDAPEFYNSRSTVMGHPQHRLLCVWHVDKNWRTQLIQKINGSQETKASVYKFIRNLLEVQDEGEFQGLLESTIHTLLLYDSTKGFGEYFRDHYAGRPHVWALCYRKGLGINTNMYLESFHKTLKYIYLEGKKCKRVDRCIFALMTLVRDHMFKRLHKIIKNKPSYRINMINTSHSKSRIFKSDAIEQVQDDCWKIKSSKGDAEYFIRKVQQSCSDGCQLFCKTCKVCVHIYTCSCPNNFIKGNMCKHIHAVCGKNKLDGNTVKKQQEEIVDMEHKTLQVMEYCERQANAGMMEINLRIKNKLDMLYACAYSSESIPTDVGLKVESHLDNALRCYNQNSKPSGHLNIKPGNKNVEKQRRFHSIKKKRQQPGNHTFKKPSCEEKKELTSLVHVISNTNKTVGHDHNYVFKNV